MLIPEKVLSKRTSEGRVCVHCNRESTNGSVVDNVFLNEMVLPRTYDECLCQSLQKMYSTGAEATCLFSFYDNHP